MTGTRRNDGIDPAARTRARRRAVQALYAWELGGNAMHKVIDDFRSEQDMQIADLGVHRLRVLGTPRKLVGLSGFDLEVVEYVEEQKSGTGNREQVNRAF